MSVKKFMLVLVGPDGDDLSALAPRLKTLSFEVGWVARSEQAASVIHSTSHVSLVVIDAVHGSDEDRRLVSAIRDMQPNLPIIWIDHGANEPVFTHDRPDAVLRAPVEPDELSTTAASLLRERFYSANLVNDFVASVRDVLRDTFSTNAKADTPILKATNNKMGELASLIYFAGRGVAGHIIASAGSEYLLLLHKRLLPDAPRPSVDKLADLLGELCNQVTGRLRVRHQFVFDVGAPIMVQGAQVVMRQLSGSPALVVRFAEAAGGFNAELCLHRLDEASVAVQTTPSLPAGELVFL